MPTWSPGDPWPGTAGGAWSPSWGGYVQLYVWAAIEAGDTFHMGAHEHDRLDAGNVLGGAPALGALGAGAHAAPSPLPGRLWRDLSCDVLDLTLAGGAGAQAGVFSKADAATVVVTLLDPGGIYDPLNPVPPFSYGGRSRLTPGVPVIVFAETVDPATAAVSSWPLFTGTADSWAEDWTPSPQNRTCALTATDDTKLWARYDQPAVTPVGAGDTIAQRLTRLAAFYGWLGTITGPASSSATLQATDGVGLGWELVNRALDNELGFVHFDGAGALRWTNRAAWLDVPTPALVLGCTEGGYDVLLDASPSESDLQIRNRIWAQRTGGAVVSRTASASISRHGTYEHKDTELELVTDAQVGDWADTLLLLYAYARGTIDDVTMRPALAEATGAAGDSAELWPLVLGHDLVTDTARIVWAPPDLPTHEVDLAMRVVGYEHAVTRSSWEVKWNLVTADPTAGAHVFTLGPHAQDRLDAGNVLALV